MNKIISIITTFAIAALLFGCSESINSPNSNLEVSSTNIPTTYAHTGNTVYADAGFAGTEDGSQSNPYNTLQEAVGHAVSGDVVMLLSDFTTNSQVTINKSLTLDGSGNTVDADFVKTDNSNNAAIGIIGTDNVTVLNLVLTASGDDVWPEHLHGVNVYESTNVDLNDLDISGFEGTGVVVNSSIVNISNIATADNGWHAINVDQRTSQPASLTISGTSSHGEVYPNTPHIFVDDITKDVEVNDVGGQYDFDLYGNAKAYFLTPNAETKEDCKKGGFADYGFKNQGQCIRFVNTGKDSR